MGIYIPDMEMPKDCLSCPCMVSDCEGDMCAFQSYEKNATFENWEQMKASCPLVPVPPHGDLIDAQEEIRLMQSCDYDTYDDYIRAFNMLDNAPTIIPAEEGECE